MDRIPDWRPVETTGPDGRADTAPATAASEGSVNWRLVAGAALALVALTGGALALSAASQSSGFSLPLDDPLPSGARASAEPGAEATAEPELVVDVGGAVERPGLYHLRPGSRVGDAIAAAGGYSVAVDLEAAGLRLNLAERLADGTKVHVPRRGEQATSDGRSPQPAPNGGGSGGLIDVNAASQGELETLPGIGPVTAGKIITARQEAPFESVDELLARRVVGPATFEKIRSLVTVGR